MQIKVNSIPNSTACVATAQLLLSPAAHFQVFLRIYVDYDFWFKRSTSSFQPINPRPNSVCIRNSVVARNNEHSPKNSFCHRDYRIVVFKIRPHSKSFSFKTIMSSEIGSTTDDNETILIHLPLPHPFQTA